MTQAALAEKAPAARAPREKLTIGAKNSAAVPPPAPAPAPATASAPIAGVVPSAPQLFPLIRLNRAPENVRHVRIDEDVVGLAADIAAHGLLQSLIGYFGNDDPGAGKVMIVGGGRRYQALMRLWEDGLIDGQFAVPVLIRDAEEAVELSLAENLQQRTMSPVDEFLAFKALIDTGHHSPEGLAARFGFSERVVRQRLRLADVVPEVLDALAEKRITIDAATAYATTQDPKLQLQVFRVQDKKGWEPHRPDKIRYAITEKGMRTTDPIFRFVTAEIYERDGGGYEDDLFTEATDRALEGKALDRPFIARAAAERMIDLQALRLIEQLKHDPKLAPTIVGHVHPESLRICRWGVSDALKAPAGYVEVDRRGGNDEKVWRTIRNNGIDVHVVVGINDEGELAVFPRRLFVPKDQKNAVDQQSNAPEQPRLTPEQQAAADRLHEINRWARRYGVGPFAGTPLEGRALWPTGYDGEARAGRRDGVNGWLVPVHVFVTDEEVAASRAEAETHVDELIAARAARKARVEQLLAADPPPAVIMVGDLLYYRWADGSWWDGAEPADGEQRDDIELGARSINSLLNTSAAIGADWPTIEAAAADHAAGGEQ